MIRRFLTFFSIALIDAYKYIVSPLLGNNCRYLPTCSEYTKESIIKFGLTRGTWLGLKRIIKCHPWGKSGHDPIKWIINFISFNHEYFKLNKYKKNMLKFL